MTGRAGKMLATSMRELLLLDAVNRAVFATRFWYWVRVRRRLHTFGNERAVIANDYSRRMLLKGRTSNRPLRLIRPLSVLDHLPKSARVLSVGCRFETELLYLVGHGFSPRNVRGLDMLSYSPWVDTGNMHSMPYAESSWDAVLLGWVLAYSDDPQKAASEVRRVARDHAVIGVGMSYYPQSQLDSMSAANRAIGDVKNRIQTVDGILSLFGDSVGEIFFRHDAADPDREGVCVVIFEIRKDDH